MRALLLVTAGAPGVELLEHRLSLEVIQVEVHADTLIETGSPQPGVVLLWARPHLDIHYFERAVGWSRRVPGVGLVGCAPQGTGLDCELALAAGFDDFMAGRDSPREVAARLRAVSRRVLRESHLTRTLPSP